MPSSVILLPSQETEVSHQFAVFLKGDRDCTIPEGCDKVRIHGCQGVIAGPPPIDSKRGVSTVAARNDTGNFEMPILVRDIGQPHSNTVAFTLRQFRYQKNTGSLSGLSLGIRNRSAKYGGALTEMNLQNRRLTGNVDAVRQRIAITLPRARHI